MKRFYIVLVCFFSLNLFSQSTLKKDSFYIPQKKFPVDYESIIKSNNWKLIGIYENEKNRILLADSSKRVTILYAHGKYIKQIKGDKIISNTDFGPAKIIYVDLSTVILEYSSKKICKKKITRELYRRQ